MPAKKPGEHEATTSQSGIQRRDAAFGEERKCGNLQRVSHNGNGPRQTVLRSLVKVSLIILKNFGVDKDMPPPAD